MCYSAEIHGNYQQKYTKALLLVISGSMVIDNRLGKLNEAIKQFYNDIIYWKNSVAKSTVNQLEVAIIAFDQSTRIIRRPKSLFRADIAPTLKTRGSTTDTVKALYKTLDIPLDRPTAKDRCITLNEDRYWDSCWTPYNLHKLEEEPNRYIYETCIEHEVTEHNMQPRLKRVLVYLAAFGFDDIQMDTVTIHIISKAEMQQRYGSAAGLHCGYSTSCNEKGRVDFHRDIYILEHYNEIRFAGTLAHELIHAWQLERNISDFNKYNEDDTYRKKCERFANIGAYVVYKQIYKETRGDIAKRYIAQMKVETDEAYGVIFRKIWERCKKVARHQIINEARMNKI